MKYVLLIIGILWVVSALVFSVALAAAAAAKRPSPEPDPDKAPTAKPQP